VKPRHTTASLLGTTEDFPMTTASPANLELAIVLPLGVLANQLMKVEADLRFLGMRASAYAGGEGGASRQVAAQMDKISETLDSIQGLLLSFAADFRPRPAGSSPSRKPNSDRDD
jgi:hypothetical protein